MKLSRRMVARAVFGAPLVLAAASAARLESLFGIAAARAAGLCVVQNKCLKVEHATSA